MHYSTYSSISSYLVDIKGASIFSKIARHTASSGIRTPTFFRTVHLGVVVPYLVHCFGSSLLAVKMKVYCEKGNKIHIQVWILHFTSLRNLSFPPPAHVYKYILNKISIVILTGPGKQCFTARNMFVTPWPLPRGNPVVYISMSRKERHNIPRGCTVI